MSKLKSAYELASTRIISSRYNQKVEKEDDDSPKMDFIEIPEFSDREDKVIESAEETKIHDKNGIEDIPETGDIRVQDSETFYYDDEIMEVLWSGNFMDYGGFARMNRTMAFGLSNRNVKVQSISISFKTNRIICLNNKLISPPYSKQSIIWIKSKTPVCNIPIMSHIIKSVSPVFCIKIRSNI